jgi:hypothetical protein
VPERGEGKKRKVAEKESSPILVLYITLPNIPVYHRAPPLTTLFYCKILNYIHIDWVL